MTKRHLDHIDLRVRDFERARRFYERLLPALGFTCDRSDTIQIINRTKRGSRFGRRHAKKWTALLRSRAMLARRIWKAQKFAPVIVWDTTRCSSKIPTATSWKSALAKIRSLQSETSSAKSSIMNDPAHVPAILQEPRRVRYLKLIALFKIAKGVLLLLLGASLLFLNARDRWMGALSDWTDEEILLGHSKAVHFLLSKLQDVLAGGGALRATGFLALFYCAVLFTEGIGVCFQKRWAELLMIFATATLIPLEARHLWHQLVVHQPIFFWRIVLSFGFCISCSSATKQKRTPSPRKNSSKLVRRISARCRTQRARQPFFPSASRSRWRTSPRSSR